MTYQLELIDPKKNQKLRSDDRVFKLKVIDNKLPLTYLGLIDKRLFSGENKLHAVKDPQYGLWKMHYEAGGLPEALQQSFTTFSALVKFAETYFAKRNVKIEEIYD